MKTIISHGEELEEETICPDCGCCFSYTDSDIEEADIDCTKSCIFVTCPECGARCDT
jgi:hypothetical protein